MVYPSSNTSSLRRSASVSQTYKASASRRRISNSAQVSSSSSALGLGMAGTSSVSSTVISSSSPPSAPVALPSTSGVASKKLAGTSATASGLPGTSTSGSPSPLRRETSLLSISRDPLTVLNPPVGGTGSGSPTPRPVRYHSGAISSGGSQSGDSPTDYKFPSSSSTSNVSPSRITSPSVAQPKVSPTSTVSRASGSNFTTTVRQGSPVVNASTGYAAGVGQSTSPISAVSPPRAAPLAISTSSPGQQSMGLSQSASFGRLSSLSVSSGPNRSSHGRSESVSSLVGSSPASGVSTSPSNTFRAFPSAPPSAPWGTQSTSPGSAGSVASLPAASGFSPGSAASAAGSSSLGSSKTEAGGFRLQRVPTSVRLAQDLHPMSPAATERRRSSLDAAMALAATSGSSGHAAFAIGGAVGNKSSSGSSSETERRDDARALLDRGHRTTLPATPMATRRNTPSPNHQSDIDVEGIAADEEGTAPMTRTGQTMSGHLRSPSQSRLLASPLIVGENTLPGAKPSARGLALQTPSLGTGSALGSSSSAFAPLFPFSVPSGSKVTLPPALSPSSRSRSHSRTRSKGSPLLDRISPRLNQDPFSAPPVSPSSAAIDNAVSPRTTVFPTAGLTDSARKRQTISTMDPPTQLTGVGLSRVSTSPTSSPKAAQDTFANPLRSTRKQFRTSMMPGSTAVSSTEDYARHLHESRASKLRKWANNPMVLTTAELASAADHTVGASSNVPSSAKSKRRAGIPDFETFGYSAANQGHCEGISGTSGDIGTGFSRPGTAGNREIEWVDWLEEYKKMKEAKIRAEAEAKKRTSTVAAEDELGEEADVATEMDRNIASGSHSRKRSDDSANASVSEEPSRRGSDDASASKGRSR